jgi:hypothetical protein
MHKKGLARVSRSEMELHGRCSCGWGTWNLLQDAVRGAVPAVTRCRQGFKWLEKPSCLSQAGLGAGDVSNQSEPSIAPQLARSRWPRQCQAQRISKGHPTSARTISGQLFIAYRPGSPPKISECSGSFRGSIEAVPSLRPSAKALDTTTASTPGVTSPVTHQPAPWRSRRSTAKAVSTSGTSSLRRRDTARVPPSS